MPTRGAIAFSLALAACSRAPSSSAPDGGTSLDPTTQAALQALAQQGQAYAGTPSDQATQKVAARMQETLWDMEVHQHTADLLKAEESNPARELLPYENQRQAELAMVASDQMQLQTLAGSKVPGQSTLATDGGAQRVIQAILFQGFGGVAQGILSSAAGGGSVPPDDQISAFLSEVAVALGDEGPGGHEVGSRIMERAILSDAGFVEDAAFKSSSFFDGGLP